MRNYKTRGKRIRPKDKLLVHRFVAGSLVPIFLAARLCVLAAFLYYRFHHDQFKQLVHPQKLARMILQNG